MTLFKSTLWTGLYTFIKLIATYITWKIIAVYTGPTGMAIIEQFQNFIQICRSFSCSLNQGIIKYVAEYKNDNENKTRILSSAFTFYFIVSFIVSLVLFCFNKQISSMVFHSLEYKNIILLLGASIILFAFNNLLLSTLNGELEIKKYVGSNIVNTFVIFFITVILAIHYGIQGALIGYVLNQSIILFLTVYLVVKSKWFSVSLYVQGIDMQSMWKLIKFAIASFVPILIVPITLLISRKFIATELSWQDAGYWQGIVKLSDGYLILMDMLISVYFFPKLSAIKSLSEFKWEIFSCYRLLIPCVLIGSAAIFLLKKYIVIMLFSAEFLPMLILFKYQLIGDIARIGTWLFAHILAAKAMIRILVLIEITSNLSFLIFTYFFVHNFGLIGTSIGFAVNSVFYFLVITFCTIKCIKKETFELA